ncbi:MAG: zinc ribbon domain-containing protein [Terriglobia bacterium]
MQRSARSADLAINAIGAGEMVDAELKTLIELQQVDHALSQVISKINSSPLEIRTLQNKLTGFVHACDEGKTRLAANQKQRRELEADVQEIRAKISKHKDQLYQVKTNEQYKAMLKEIEAEDSNIRTIEDRVLEKMVEAEQIERLIREATSRLDTEKKGLEEEVRSLESRRQADERERDRLEGKRKGLVEALARKIYLLYEKLAKARNGMALAEVIEGFCSGCHFRLRPQAYNDVRTSEHLITCETCSRILYYVERAPEDPAPEDGERSQPAAIQ